MLDVSVLCSGSSEDGVMEWNESSVLITLVGSVQQIEVDGVRRDADHTDIAKYKRQYVCEVDRTDACQDGRVKQQVRRPPCPHVHYTPHHTSHMQHRVHHPFFLHPAEGPTLAASTPLLLRRWWPGLVVARWSRST